MRSRLVMFVAVAVAAVAVSLTAFRLIGSPSPPVAAHATLPPRSSSYLGVYENGSPPGYAPIARFARAAHATPNIVGYYSGWAQHFATAFANKLNNHDITPFVQIDPTFASVQGIANGAYDRYLRSYADSVRNYRQAVVIGFGHEMNAPWYPWGYGHVPAATFIAAWRHVVTLFRAQGADNVTWLWTVNADRRGTGPVASWWPGAQYVTWVGIDGYYYYPSDTFASVFGRTISQVRKFTRKPVLLSEVGVGPVAGQLPKIGDLFNGMTKAKSLGLVWFDKAQHQGIFHQDWRIENSQSALAAFDLGVSGLRLVRT
jgi:mannan endo-1,4-beta-mannosidase